MKGCRDGSCIPEDCPYGDIIVALVFIIYLLVIFIPFFDSRVTHPLRCGWLGIISIILIWVLLCFVCYWPPWFWLVFLFALIIIFAVRCYERR